MQALHNSEIDSSISCFWDDGRDVKLGDELNGWRAEENLRRGQSWTMPPHR